MTEYHLIDLYAGQIVGSFQTAEELKSYMKRKQERGTLMGVAAYTIVKGVVLSIEQFYPSITGWGGR